MMQRAEIARSLLGKNLSLIRLAKHSKKPIETDWQTGERNISAADLDRIDDFNLGIVCGREIEPGHYLLAVDIDAQRDGSIEKLQELTGLKCFDDTLIVRTGSGGFHYFFTTEEPMPLMVDPAELKGIEFRGAGAQVVAPGSIHPNGNTYEVISDPGFIESAPPELVALIKRFAKEKNNRQTHLDQPDIKIKSNRNVYLTARAGSLLNSGVPKASLLECLMSIDREVCDPPLQSDPGEKPSGKKQIESIVRQAIKKWDVNSVVTAEAYEVERFDPGSSAPVEPVTKPKRSAVDFEGLLRQADGLIRDIAVDVLRTAHRPYPQFALASSFVIVSAVAQGSYSAPNLTHPTEPCGNLSLYQTIIAPAAGGKDHYLKAVEKYLHLTDKRLIASDFGSVNGMISGFFAFNSRISIIDEMQDHMAKLGAQKGSYLNQILTLIKELYSDRDFIREQQTKASVFPEIKLPKYSIFSAGTEEGFVNQIRGDQVSGGLQSRFLVWPHLEVTKSQPRRRLEPKDHVIERLAEIVGKGASDGFEFNYLAQQKLILKHGSGRAKEKDGELFHTPAVRPKKTVALNREAVDVLVEFRKKQEQIYLRYTNELNKSGSDMSPGSIIDRSSQLAIKLACLHAVGRGKEIADRSDAELAVGISELLTELIADAVDINSQGDERVSRIITVLKDGEPRTMREITQRLRSISTQDIHMLCLDLVFKGIAQAVDKDGRVMDLEPHLLPSLKGRVPRGAKLIFTPQRIV